MSRYLLDSHAFLWYDNGDRRLGTQHREVLNDPASELFLSVASIWELSIKRSLGRLEHTIHFRKTAEKLQIKLIPVLAEHAEEVERLLYLHGDPFDHMLVAQARLEGLVLVTHDAKLHQYNVPMLRI